MNNTITGKERFNELFEKRKNLTASIFEEEEMISLYKSLPEKDKIGIDENLVTYSDAGRLDNINNLLDKLLSKF